MWVVVYKWYIWPKHNNALVTNSSVKSRRGTIGIQLSTLEICSASFLFLPALYYGCFYSMLAVNSFNPELSSFNNSTFHRLITQHCRGAFTPGKFGWPFSRPWCVLEHTNRKLNLNHKFLTLIFCDAVWMSQMNTCVFTKLNVLFQFSSVWVIAITSWRRGMMGITCCLKWLEVIWTHLKKTNQFQV
jgi:hypothetical protein